MNNRSLSYRPDIDGLRALAVLSVVVFHFNAGWLPGGFVGVDIFFVISGFLITGIVAKQVAKEGFSFGDFYLRRIFRILPAASFVTIFTLVFGLAFMLPDDAKALSSSSIAAVLSLANVYFWKFLDTSYFAESSETVPLLHMWSLGIEEQFYLIWPALLVLTYKIGRRFFVVSVATVIAIASFWFGEHMLSRDHSFAYYMLPSRAGELLAGGITFFICDFINGRIGRVASEVLAFMGGALIGWSLLFIRESDGFPGFISAMPVLGAALIIAAGCFQKTYFGMAISIRPMLVVGLASFSLYLWHWPVLAMYRYAYGEPDLIGLISCAVVIVVLTGFTYQYVEKPFRFGVDSSFWLRLSAVVGVVALVVSLSVYSVNKKGLILPLSPDGYYSRLLEHFNQTKAAYRYEYNCQVDMYLPEIFHDEKCMIGPKNQDPKILIFGDSNAAHYVGYMKEVAEFTNQSMRNVSHSACIPFPGDKSREYVADFRKDSCVKFNAKLRESFNSYDVLVVGVDWEGYRLRGKNYWEDVESLVEELSVASKKVVIGLKVPLFRKYDRRCDSKSIKIPYMNCTPRGEYEDKGETEVNSKIIEIASRYNNVSTFSVRDYICKSGVCSAYLEGRPIYFDPGHLSMAGSISIGKLAVANGDIPKALLDTQQR